MDYHHMMENLSCLTLTDNNALNVAHIEDSALLTEDSAEASKDVTATEDSTETSEWSDNNASDSLPSESSVLSADDSAANCNKNGNGVDDQLDDDVSIVAISESSGYGSPARSPTKKKHPYLPVKDTFSRARLSPKKTELGSDPDVVSPRRFHSISESDSVRSASPVKTVHWDVPSTLNDALVESSTTSTVDYSPRPLDRDAFSQLRPKNKLNERDGSECDNKWYHSGYNAATRGQVKYQPVTAYAANLGRSYRCEAASSPPPTSAHNFPDKEKFSTKRITSMKSDVSEKPSFLNDARIEASVTDMDDVSHRKPDLDVFHNLQINSKRDDDAVCTARQQERKHVTHKTPTHNRQKYAPLTPAVDSSAESHYKSAPSSPAPPTPHFRRQPVSAPTTPAGDAASVTSECPSRWSDFVSEDESYATAPDGPPRVPEELLYRRLLAAGESPGPVTSGTAALYRRRLARLEERAARFTPELDACLRAAPAQLGALERLETRMAASLAGGAGPATRRTCFNYLLLDPRVTQTIAAGADTAQAFAKFAAAVFYVGKGQQSRPHQHLLDAAAAARGRPASAKLRHIRAVWAAGRGVVLLIVFHHRLPDEALTREAAMIDALGLRNLTNVRSGNYYGAAKAWSVSERRRLGAGLLHKALRIYLVEGETQLRPGDLGTSAHIDLTDDD